MNAGQDCALRRAAACGQDALFCRVAAAGVKPRQDDSLELSAVVRPHPAGKYIASICPQDAGAPADEGFFP
jgi:hypothetical protein